MAPRRPRTPAARPPPRRQPAADRRVQVVLAARALFARDGPDGVAMRAIAARAGVSAAALYLYFPDKRALMAAVCDSIFAELIAMFTEAGAGVPSADPFARLRGFMNAYVRWGIAHPAEYRLLFMVKEMHEPGAPGHRGPPRPGDPQLGGRLFALLQQEVEARMADATMRPADPAMTAEAIWATGHGLIALLTTLSRFPFTPPERIGPFLADTVLRGLAAG